MRIKTATLLGLIGAILSILITLYYLIHNFMCLPLSEGMYICTTILSILSEATLAIFFYTLYMNQK